MQHLPFASQAVRLPHHLYIGIRGRLQGDENYCHDLVRNIPFTDGAPMLFYTFCDAFPCFQDAFPLLFLCFPYDWSERGEPRRAPLNSLEWDP